VGVVERCIADPEEDFGTDRSLADDGAGRREEDLPKRRRRLIRAGRRRDVPDGDPLAASGGQIDSHGEPQRQRVLAEQKPRLPKGRPGGGAGKRGGYHKVERGVAADGLNLMDRPATVQLQVIAGLHRELVRAVWLTAGEVGRRIEQERILARRATAGSS